MNDSSLPPPADDFVASSRNLEQAGAFKPLFPKTIPAARRIVRDLLAKESRSRDSSPAPGSLYRWFSRAVAASSSRGAAFSGAGILASPASPRDLLLRAKPADPLPPVVLHFRSVQPPPSPAHWRADLRISPSGRSGSGRVDVRFSDPPAANGSFFFCGVSVPVFKGRASFPLSDLRANLARGGVSFTASGASPSPGAPVLQV